eukprot:403356380
MGNHPFTMHLRKNKFARASSGMGKEFVFRYSQRDCKVVIGSRNAEKLQQIAEQCMRQFPNSTVVPVQTDVTKEDECQRLIDVAIERFGRIDILILNAGISAHQKFEEVQDMKIFHQIMETNFYGYLYPTRYALPYLKKSHGQIVVMSSYSGEIGLHYRTAYCASKFAVTGFFESLRMELSDQIYITIICPITVETSFRENSLIKPVGDDNHQMTYEETKKRGSSMAVEDAIDVILTAIDVKMRKIFFPTKAWFANYLRPIFPDIIDRKLYAMAKL